MSYVTRNLVPDEEILFRAHYSFIIFIKGCVIGAIIPFFTSEFVITNRRVIMKHGLISQHIFEMKLEKIESVNVQQKIYQRILGYGTVRIVGSGGSGKKFDHIARPMDFKNAFIDATSN